MNTLREFRAFILRGNVVDLAIAVIIGAAFGAVVDSLVKDVFLPLIAAIVGEPNFGNLVWFIGKGEIRYGNVLTAIVNFLIIAAVLFFIVVRPVNALMARFKPETPEPETTRECPYCLSKVPQAASKCAFCTSSLQPVA